MEIFGGGSNLIPVIDSNVSILMVHTLFFFLCYRVHVPLGSILGPLLFLIYINDLFSTVHTSNILSSADDTECYKLILELRDSAKLQHDLNSMAIWSRDWNLFFNTNKFIHLSFFPNFQPLTLLATPQFKPAIHIATLASLYQLSVILHGKITTTI